MRAALAPGLVTRWPWRSEQSDGPAALSHGRAASRVESYVYGNVLVLAALDAISSQYVLSGRAVLLVTGTAVSTFVAHVLAVVVGHRLESAGPDPHPLRDALRDSVPIATSGLVPAAILVIGWRGWLLPAWALGAAIGASTIRLFLLGSVVSYLLGERSTWRNVLVGCGLAVLGLLVAALKTLIAH